jgi:hypothetical protein
LLVADAGRIASEIERDIALGPAAADQHVAVGRWLDRVGPIADGTGDEPGLAIFADPGAARLSLRTSRASASSIRLWNVERRFESVFLQR